MKKNTVFIVGAGASKEVNIPTGYELKDVISQLLDIKYDTVDRQISGDHTIAYALQEHVKGQNRYPDWRFHAKSATHSI